VKHVKVYDVSQRVHGKVGRPKAVTKEQLLHAIEMYATDSVTILAKKLQVSRKTIYARLEEIPRKEINGNLVKIGEKIGRNAKKRGDCGRYV